MKIKIILLYVLISVSCASCGGSKLNSYAPKSILKEMGNHETINKSFKIETFTGTVNYNEEPDDLRNEHRLEITDEFKSKLTEALVNYFEQNKLFHKASCQIENPDYIIKPIVRSYNLTMRLSTGITFGIALFVPSAIISAINPTAVIPLVYSSAMVIYMFSGVPTFVNENNIALEFDVYDKNNVLVGTYNGTASKMSRSNIYNRARKPLKEADESLTLVFNQIRQQILADIDKYK